MVTYETFYTTPYVVFVLVHQLIHNYKSKDFSGIWSKSGNLAVILQCIGVVEKPFYNTA